MVGLLSLAALVMAWIALRRSRESERLARRVSELEAQLRGLVAVIGGARPTAPVEDIAAPQLEPTHERPLIEDAPSPPEPTVVAALKPPLPPPVIAPPPPPRPPAFEIDWEQWIGVRGAAVVGGIVLALAGIFLFRYSIEHGLIPPWLRVVAGLVGGTLCIGGSERWLRARYEVTANGVAGAGVVILYASLWAAHALYALVGQETTLAAMILVTATCCALSWRHESLVIALIGLVGGFLTPLLLATDADRPIGLFTYVLLLDVGLLYMASRRTWPVLTILSLAATFLYQAGWILTRMRPESVPLAFVILTVFAIVFTLAGRRGAGREDPLWLVMQAGGVLLPFGLAVYFAGRAELTPHLYPLATMMVILAGAAGWIARVQQAPRVGMAAATAVVGVMATWTATHALTWTVSWEVVGLGVLLAAGLHFFVEWGGDGGGWDGPAPAALVANLGIFLLFVVVVPEASAGPWPWIAAWTALAALQLRHAAFRGMELLNVVAAVLLGTALALLTVGGGPADNLAAVDPRLYLGTLVGLAVLFQLHALLPGQTSLRAWRERGAALLALMLIVPFVITGVQQLAPPMIVLSGAALLGVLAALAATRVPSGAWLLAAVIVVAMAHSIWTLDNLRPATETARLALVIQFAAVQLFGIWPFLFTMPLRHERWAWNAAALAAPLWFLSLRHLFEQSFGDAYIGALPLMLGVSAVVAAGKVRQMWSDEDDWRRQRLAWFLAAAMGFVTVAIPLQLDRSWITVGWALQGAAVVYLWQRLDQPGLKYFAMALFVAVTIRLIGNPAVLEYYPRSEWRVINWLLYTYLVPAAAMLWSAVTLSRPEIARARPWERQIYRRGYPVGALAVGFAALAVGFVWINLAIADWYTTGPLLRLRFERMAARDLTTSIAWAGYALALLAAGVRFTNRGVRWVSLGLMMVTIVKVFLYDLGELRDLYRVASLFGLAVSLIVVSLAYQRFVLRKPAEESP